MRHLVAYRCASPPTSHAQFILSLFHFLGIYIVQFDLNTLHAHHHNRPPPPRGGCTTTNAPPLDLLSCAAIMLFSVRTVGDGGVHAES
jgi:hypothetical protein